MADHLSEDELIKLIDHAACLVEVGATYSHYRNPESHYIVTGFTVIDATQSIGVAYRKKTGSKVLQEVTWIRPLKSWIEQISVNKDVIPRFQKINH